MIGGNHFVLSCLEYHAGGGVLGVQLKSFLSFIISLSVLLLVTVVCLFLTILNG